MIQRIQTVWLLLAALIGAALFGTDLYSAHILQNGADTVKTIRVMGDHYPTLILGVVVTLLPLIAIFMFRNRKRQRGLAVLGIVATAGFISMIVMRVGNLNNSVPTPTDGHYHIWAVLPVLSLICLVLALRGIRKDDKLVKSLDRLR